MYMQIRRGPQAPGKPPKKPSVMQSWASYLPYGGTYQSRMGKDASSSYRWHHHGTCKKFGGLKMKAGSVQRYEQHSAF